MRATKLSHPSIIPTVNIKWNDQVVLDQLYYLERSSSRCIALIGSEVYTSTTEAEIKDRLVFLVASSKIIKPFVFLFEGFLQYGLYKHEWAIDLYKWAYNQPTTMRDVILGMLFGYSSDAIAEYLENEKYWYRKGDY